MIYYKQFMISFNIIIYNYFHVGLSLDKSSNDLDIRLIASRLDRRLLNVLGLLYN